MEINKIHGNNTDHGLENLNWNHPWEVCNFINRVYVTPVRFCKMGTVDLIFVGTFFHMVWDCAIIKVSRENVTLGKIIGHNIPCDPVLCLNYE